MVKIDVMFQFLGALYDFMIIKLMVIVIGFGAVPKYAMPEKALEFAKRLSAILLQQLSDKSAKF